MTKEYFEELRDNVIMPFVEDLLKIDADYNCLKLNKSALNKIYYNYEQKRQTIRRYFMNIETKPMDRHKIGSVMLYAVIKSHVFSINLTKRRLPHELLMANEYLAVYMALTMVDAYRRDAYYCDDSRKNQIKENEWLLKLPATFHEETSNSYINNLCKALYYVKNPNNIDIFAYANIFYLLEVYTNEKNGYTPPQT